MRIKMPAVRIAQADADSAADGDAATSPVRVPSPASVSGGTGHGTGTSNGPGDTLTCGACRRMFALADIIRFIQHKVHTCGKDPPYTLCFQSGPSSDRDTDDGSRPTLVSGTRPSLIGARRPPSSRVHTPPPASPALLAPADLLEDGAASSTPKRLLDDAEGGTSTPKRRASSSPMASSSPEDDIKPKIKQEHIDTSSSLEDGHKKSRTEVADAESNTMHSEPSNYVCSTCKARVHSAWRLVQHVQHAHGVKIYVESSPGGPNGSNGPGGHGGSGGSSGSSGHHSSNRKDSNNHSSSSSCSTSSACSSGGQGNLPPPGLRHHPLLPPPDIQSPFGVGGLLRMPLAGSLPPLPHPPVPQAPLFVRPNHHDHRFRMEQLMSEQFRHHGLNLAAAAAAVAANALPPHQPFPSPADRPPLVPTTSASRDRNLPPVSQPLSLEPQLDFYSQRLRQLAGTTSPGAATGNSSSPSPRKHSPPFASPSPSQLQPTSLINNNNNSNSRPHSSSPPEKRSELSTTPTSIPPITTTPRSASTPPSKQALSQSNSSNDAVHACEFCGKKFRFQSNLIVHRRAHTGEKPYKCTVCDHACAQSSKLKRHMKIHKSPDDQTSNADSAETLDEDDSNDELDEEEMDVEEEEDNDELQEDEAEDLTVPSSGILLPKRPTNTSTNPLVPTSVNAASLVGELMDKFGLSNIAQYSEAYKQALQESGNALKWQLSKDRDNNNGLGAVPPGIEKLNGLQPNSGLRLKEEFAKNMLGPPGQGAPPHPLFNPFENPFEASKRMKLEMERGESWWLPNLHGQRPPDNIFDGLKASPNSLLQNPLLKSKDSRRNDTCEFCGKVFKNCSNLTVHRRSHTGEKPYKCELCSYACAQSSKLTRHMKTHGRLGKDVYRCRFCEMPFSVPSTLEKHMRKCVVNQSNGGGSLGVMSDDSNACKEEAT